MNKEIIKKITAKKSQWLEFTGNDGNSYIAQIEKAVKTYSLKIDNKSQLDEHGYSTRCYYGHGMSLKEVKAKISQYA